MRQILPGLIAILLPAFAWAGPVNINTADANTLAEELVGIGLSKAQAIVNYRNEFGAFEVAEELLKVKGIGPRVLDANKDNIQIAE